MYRYFWKRILDLFISGIALVVLSPLLLILGLVIRIDSPGKAFYTQIRIGKNKKKFKLYKFRTMLPLEDSYDTNGNLLANYERVTRVGRILRRTSLDELPQIINIFKGEMSFIGPRPTLEYQVKRYNKLEEERLSVRPGLTGLAQVNGRNNISWDQKIQHDLRYIENINFFRDLIILLKTISVVLKGNDVQFNINDEISKHSDGYQEDI